MLNVPKVNTGINIVPQNTEAVSSAGDIRFNSSTLQLDLFTGSVEQIVSTSTAQVLLNKTLGATNTATGIKMASFTPDGTNTLTAPATTDTLVGKATTDTLTNKTIALANNTISTSSSSVIITNTSGVAVPLTQGSNGQVLTIVSNAPAWSNANAGTVTSVAATVPNFLTVGGSPITTSGTLAFAQTALNAQGDASYTLISTDYIVTFAPSAADRTATLPTAASLSGKVYQIINSGNSASHVLKIATSLSQTIGGRTMSGSTQIVLSSPNSQLIVVSDGTNWQILHSDESIVAFYNGTPSGSISSGVATTNQYPTKVTDTHSAFSSGIFTAPVGGYYNVTSGVDASITAATGQDAQIITIRTNSTDLVAGIFYPTTTSGVQVHPQVAANGIYLAAGDTIQSRTTITGTGPTYSAGLRNHFSVIKIG